MYSYEWDEETGGLLLNSAPLSFSKEPRPVYYQELDLLGFDKYWNYEKNDVFPYMWAESSSYWYRGRRVARIKGGSVYCAPELIILEEPEPNNALLRFVDVPRMVEKNKEILETLVQSTIVKVFDTYTQYKDKADVFYVAFSGGKDSTVTFDIVQRTLPANKFKVLFGDTGMEFPDTYKTVNAVEKICREKGIDFIRAASDYMPEESWKLFGPPASVNRWCCGVHKTAPQVLALREATGKINFTGMAFIGVRASESLCRSNYDYLSLGEKHKGQYSCNPILQWNSAEVYLYILSEGLYLNEAYKKGNRRAGCLACPKASERNDYLARMNYTEEFDAYIDTVKSAYRNRFDSEEQMDDFIDNGGWKARKNGRDIDTPINYVEILDDGVHTIKVIEPRTSWKEWIKTIGVLLNDESPYRILFRDKVHEVEIEENGDTIEITFEEAARRKNASFFKLLKNVFRKAACCVQCHECEADCHNGCITMGNGKVKISDDCVHCSQCHKVQNGCLVYKSLQMPKSGNKKTHGEARRDEKEKQNADV